MNFFYLKKEPWFSKLRQHPIFPLLLLIPMTQIIRDEFPISHYPMFSRPSMSDVTFVYVSGPDAKPLPVKTESGISVAQVGKKFAHHKRELIRKFAKIGRHYDQMTNDELAQVEKEAAIETLNFVRGQSLKRRPGSDLTGELRLNEVKLVFLGDTYSEIAKTLAILPSFL